MHVFIYIILNDLFCCTTSLMKKILVKNIYIFKSSYEPYEDIEIQMEEFSVLKTENVILK